MSWPRFPSPARLTPAIVALIGLLTGGGCTDAEEADCLREPPLTYDNWGKGFLEKNCTGCHSSYLTADQRNNAPIGVDFNTYAGVVQWWERIEARSTTQTMPPGGGLLEQDLTNLSEWLHCQVQPDAEALAAQQEGT